MSDIPNEAVAAGIQAVLKLYDVQTGHEALERDVRAVLEAAAPHIAAAERERCAQLAEQDAAHADLQVASDEARIVGEVLRNFAAKLREPQP